LPVRARLIEWLILDVSRRLSRGGDAYVALCPEYDVASQGAIIEEARENLIEALTLFFECADPAEINHRFRPDVFVTQVEVRVA
jgi:predicted RNase H-like HicB family nuclease